MRVLLPAVLVVLAGCAGNDVAETTPPASPQIREFEQRLAAYTQVKEQAGKGLLPIPDNTTPGDINAIQQKLAARLRERRANAQQGDIFTPEVRAHFRRLIAGPLTGPRSDNIRALMEQDAPAPGAIPLEVHAIYPASQPYTTSPPSVLALLPTLPKGLEFRIVGRDLILLDQTANMIVDYMRNAIPADRD